MKNLLLILLLVPCLVFGQTTDATLTTQAQQIKNETTPGANTANRVGTHLQNLVYSKKSFFIDGTASGTDTYSVTLNNGAVTVLSSQWFVVKFTNANTGAATLNINSIGAKALKKTDGSALSSGDIDPGSIHLLSYDGTNLQVLSLGGGGISSVAWGTITGTLSDQTDLQTALNGKQSTITFGTGVQTALGVNIGSAGAPVLFNGALGTPSSGTGTNITGIVAANVVNTPAGGIAATNVQTALNELDTEKDNLTNSSSSLTNASTVTITGLKHTLSSNQATITWTLSQTSDFQTTDITLNVTSATWTFPANTLCVVEGVASGDNTASLTGVSGDHHIMSIYKDGSNYRVVIKNFGQ